ncbi:BlaI/MecI/CopY family transcriptional regulator [bacterium]|nr:BlaI/MecI/CopY family transcriptional regulator [bacterium]MCI0606509.1 BlaI/MecI/CopY family transcriptional regulator [bacterium]
MKRKIPHFTFDPNKKGLQKILGELEAEIMEVVWERGEVTVRQVQERLERKREIAYTTVMTVMSRLAEKGLLRQIRDGMAFSYRPAYSKEEFTEGSVKKILTELLEDFSAPVLHQFVNSVQESQPERMEELARLVESKRKKENV